MSFIKKDKFDELFEKIKNQVASVGERDDKLKHICLFLKNGVPYYDWVGFYIVDPTVKNELYLGPYVGEPTEHTRIAFGVGICGQAAQRKETFVIQDVTKETNYLSCSPEVKSEIVVPIFKGNDVIGEIDIDSHALSPFTAEDSKFLESVAEIISSII